MDVNVRVERPPPRPRGVVAAVHHAPRLWVGRLRRRGRASPAPHRESPTRGFTHAHLIYIRLVSASDDGGMRGVHVTRGVVGTVATSREARDASGL